MRFKLIILAVLLLSGKSMLKAQPRWDMGFHGGPLLSTMPGVANSSLWKLSGQGGFLFTRRDNKKNYLQIEVNFIRKGAWRKVTENNPSKLNLSFYYAEFPVLYRFENLKISRKGRGGWEVGLSYAHIVSPQLRVDGERIELEKQKYDDYDMSVLAGVHVIFTNHVMIRGRITYSINPIMRSTFIPDVLYNIPTEKTHNITLQFGVAWLIRGLYY